MSEWIDFALDAFQIVLLWVLFPRQSVKFTVPAIMDRDPAWPAAHPEAVQAIARSRWFVKTFYTWAALSIGVLLAVRLGIWPSAANSPSWEVLKDVHGALLIVGILGYSVCFLYWTRWLTANVPLAEQRRATLKPRAVSDYVPSAWRIATEVLTAVHLAAWLIVPALGFSVDADYWATFAFVVALTVLFAITAHWTPRRRPNYGDRLFGESYRRVELRVVYAMRLAPLVLAGVVLGETVTGLDLARAGHLLGVLCVSGFALAFLRLRPLELGGGARGPQVSLASERRSAA